MVYRHLPAPKEEPPVPFGRGATRYKMEPRAGVEPATVRLQNGRTTSCATKANRRRQDFYLYLWLGLATVHPLTPRPKTEADRLHSQYSGFPLVRWYLVRRLRRGYLPKLTTNSQKHHPSSLRDITHSTYYRVTYCRLSTFGGARIESSQPSDKRHRAEPILYAAFAGLSPAAPASWSG